MRDASTARIGTVGGEASVGPFYRRRRPEQTVLHRLVRAHLETCLARAETVDPVGGGVSPITRGAEPGTGRLKVAVTPVNDPERARGERYTDD